MDGKNKNLFYYKIKIAKNKNLTLFDLNTSRNLFIENSSSMFFFISRQEEEVDPRKWKGSIFNTV